MAGTYATDLTTMNDGTINNAADEVSAYNAAATFVENDGDIFIQGTSAYSALSAQKNANVGNSLVYDGVSVTIGGGDVFSIWGLWPVPSGLGTFNNTTPGVMLVVGTSLTAISTYVVDGSDTFPFGGWRNYVVDLRNTPTGPNSGGGGTTNSVYGLVYFIITAFNRSVLFSIDALRYGRMTMTATGGTGTSVSYSSPLTSSSANFPQMADYNDYNGGGTPSFGTAVDGGYHVFGQFQEIAGGFLMKGVVSLGVTGGSAVFFDDANRLVLIEDAYLTYNDFNRIEIRNAESTVNMSSITFAFSPRPEVILAADAPATPRGNWEVVDNATVALGSCTFVDMGTFIFQSNSELTSCIFRRTDLVTQGGATITSCTFTNTISTTTSLLSSPTTISSVTDCTFNRTTGTANAVDLGNISTGTTITWDGNRLFGYGNQTAGNNISSTANGAIAVNFTSNVTLSISIVNGATIPTVEISGTGTVNITADVTVNINGLKDASEVRIYSAGTTTELAGVESVSGGSGTGVSNGTVSGSTDNNTFSFTSSAGADIDIRIFNIDFNSTQFENFTVSANGDNITAVQVSDSVFSDPV